MGEPTLLDRRAPNSAGIARAGMTFDLDPFYGVVRVQLRGADQPLADVLGVALPPPGRGVADASQTVGICWTSPGEWTLLGEETAVSELVERLRRECAGVAALITDLGHARAAFRLSGAGARDALAAHCPLDFSDDVFPVTAVANSLLGEASLLLGRRADEAGAPSYRIVVDQTMAGYAARLFAGPGGTIA
ncbi:sarcosine oxidase subunit gamma [Sphingomonas sp.]|uniref:sarcosine oxidase subunit gamma n=1 Tax=Sphingomonas sp. TaxID=28214 RepID=UPI003D6CDBD9